MYIFIYNEKVVFNLSLSSHKLKTAIFKSL